MPLTTEELDSFAGGLIRQAEDPNSVPITAGVYLLDIAHIIVESDGSALSNAEQVHGMEKLLHKVLKAKIARMFDLDELDAAKAANVVGERLWQYAKANPRER
jgi:hypothetical protein